MLKEEASDSMASTASIVSIASMVSMFSVASIDAYGRASGKMLKEDA